MGVWSNATNGWDDGIDYLIGTFGEGFAGVYHEYGSDYWLGPTGFYHTDFRKILADDESKTWSPIHVWATPKYHPETMFFSMRPDFDFTPPSDRNYLLTLDYVPPGVVGAPDVGQVWNVSATDGLTLELPTIRTFDGREGYRFSFEMTETVPEPSTLGLLAAATLPLWRRSRGRR